MLLNQARQLLQLRRPGEDQYLQGIQLLDLLKDCIMILPQEMPKVHIFLDQTQNTTLIFLNLMTSKYILVLT